MEKIADLEQEWDFYLSGVEITRGEVGWVCGLRSLGNGSPKPAEDFLECIQFDRLHQVQVDTRLQRPPAVTELPIPGHGYEQWRRTLGIEFTDLSGDFPTVQVRQPDVQQNDVGGRLLDRFEGRGAVGSDPHAMPIETKHRRQTLRGVRAVFDNQNAQTFMTIPMQGQVRSSFHSQAS
jgi:hypothetical protein